MRVIHVHEYGGPEVLRYDDVPLPEPGVGEALVRIGAVGVNFVDIYQRTGQYPGQLPMTPGREAAGAIDAVGPGVSDIRRGDRVVYAGHVGSYGCMPSSRIRNRYLHQL